MIRTEDDILEKRPVEVTLGSTKYNFPPLPVTKARAWRVKFTEAMNEIVTSFGASPEPGNLGPAMTSALIRFPEKIEMLVFAWDPEIEKKREQILEEATEEQLAAAFAVIVKLAFPYLGQLNQTVAVLKASL